MTDNTRSIRERVFALAEEGGLSASTAGEMCNVPKSTAIAWLQTYRSDGQVGRRRGTGLWRVSSPAQYAALVAEAQINLCVSARDLKSATGFPGQKNYAYFEIERKQASGHDTLR
jgi:transposase